jgi:predicted aspartyl protease
MKALGVFFTFFSIHCLAFQLYADGTFYIGKDAGGVYFQTDRDGGWYIDRQDLKSFKFGETGVYYIETDRYGTYLKTDKGNKFYIDLDAKGRLDQETGRFNQEQEKGVGLKETQVIIRGNLVLVPVILGYRGMQTEALFLLDTGASITVLHKDIADQLNIKQVQKAKLLTLGGKSIPAYVAKLNFARVGPHQKESIYAGIIEYQGPKVDYQGLLGMNFLRNIEYAIDFQKQTIKWK